MIDKRGDLAWTAAYGLEGELYRDLMSLLDRIGESLALLMDSLGRLYFLKRRTTISWLVSFEGASAN
jgi:hypothetical protein